MYSIKRIVTAGIVTVALGAWPGAAAAQSSSTAQPQGTSPQTGADSSSQQPSGQQPSGQQPSGQQSSQGQSNQGGGNQEAVRQHLADARTALAELTKLPEAAQLQGQQRDQVASLISNFNAFATATTDWRSKYEVVDTNLDEMLGAGEQAAAPSAAASTPASADPAAPSSAGSSTASEGAASAGTGGFDPAIAAKLQEVRTHLNKFEEATGDPVFVVEKIEKILDQAAKGGDQAVGTSGAASSAGAGGAVTLDASQISEIRRHLESIRTAAKQ